MRFWRRKPPEPEFDAHGVPLYEGPLGVVLMNDHPVTIRRMWFEDGCLHYQAREWIPKGKGWVYDTLEFAGADGTKMIGSRLDASVVIKANGYLTVSGKIDLGNQYKIEEADVDEL